ncbi:MAG: hypothetical protein AABY78_03865 [Nitrospirota bacterium]|jgi:hypothetical protein
MCQGNIFIDLKKNCGCEPESETESIDKEELLAQLKEHKRKIESELVMVKNKLGKEVNKDV